MGGPSGPSGPGGQAFPFVVVHEGKNIELAAASEDERLAWIAVITDFVKAEIARGR